MEHTLCESPFSCTMKHCGPASRESVNALANRDLGVTEQGRLRVGHGVSLRDPVPHAHFRTSSIVQPCAKRLHALCHVPNVLFAAFAHNFDCLSWFVFGVGSCNNFQAFLLSLHVQVFHCVGHDRQDPNQVLNGTRHCIQVICPAQMMKHQVLGAIHVFSGQRKATLFFLEPAVVGCQFEANFLRFQTSSRLSECVVKYLIPHIGSFDASLPSTTNIWKGRRHWGSRQINSTFEITGFPEQGTNRSRMNFFLQQGTFNIHMFYAINSTLHISRCHKGFHTPFSSFPKNLSQSSSNTSS